MKKFYPVIHVQSFEQAMSNIETAYNAGADGAFIINHSIASEELLHIHRNLLKIFDKEVASFPIGINCLDLSPFELIFEIDNSIPMIWVDNCLIDDELPTQVEAKAVKEAIEKTSWHGQYFGGVDFKYQKPAKDLELATELAALYADVVITSGPGTGIAASPEKLRRMKSVLHDKSLAIASGITAANVLDYMDSVDIFLVSTGISKSFSYLDAKKTEELAKIIHGK